MTTYDEIFDLEPTDEELEALENDNPYLDYLDN